jgi:anti-anti-sigma factor
MEVMVTKEGSVKVLKPIGSFIAGELEPIERELEDLCLNWTKRTVVDLEDVGFIDSAGLELLCRIQQQLNEHGLQLKLCGLNEITQKIFDLTRLSRRFEILPETASALRSFL